MSNFKYGARLQDRSVGVDSPDVSDNVFIKDIAIDRCRATKSPDYFQISLKHADSNSGWAFITLPTSAMVRHFDAEGNANGLCDLNLGKRGSYIEERVKKSGQYVPVNVEVFSFVSRLREGPDYTAGSGRSGYRKMERIPVPDGLVCCSNTRSGTSKERKAVLNNLPVDAIHPGRNKNERLIVFNWKNSDNGKACVLVPVENIFKSRNGENNAKNVSLGYWGEDVTLAVEKGGKTQIYSMRAPTIGVTFYREGKNLVASESKAVESVDVEKPVPVVSQKSAVPVSESDIEQKSDATNGMVVYLDSVLKDKVVNSTFAEDSFNVDMGVGHDCLVVPRETLSQNSDGNYRIRLGMREDIVKVANMFTGVIGERTVGSIMDEMESSNIGRFVDGSSDFVDKPVEDVSKQTDQPLVDDKAVSAVNTGKQAEPVVQDNDMLFFTESQPVEGCVLHMVRSNAVVQVPKKKVMTVSLDVSNVPVADFKFDDGIVSFDVSPSAVHVAKDHRDCMIPGRVDISFDGSERIRLFGKVDGSMKAFECSPKQLNDLFTLVQQGERGAVDVLTLSIRESVPEDLLMDMADNK